MAYCTAHAPPLRPRGGPSGRPEPGRNGKAPVRAMTPEAGACRSAAAELYQKPVPIWNWKRCVSSPSFSLSGQAMENFSGPSGEIQAMPMPVE